MTGGYRGTQLGKMKGAAKGSITIPKGKDHDANNLLAHARADPRVANIMARHLAHKPTVVANKLITGYTPRQDNTNLTPQQDTTHLDTLPP